MADGSMRFRRAMALAAAVAGVVTDSAYLRLILDQGSQINGRVGFYAGYVALMALLALTGAVLSGRDARLAQATLLAASSGFVGAGLLALFSIGMALLLAGILAAIAAGPRRESGRIAAGIIVGALAILAVGLALTS